MTYRDVLDLAIEKSKGKADVFVNFQAHVNSIGIRIYPRGFDGKVLEDNFTYDRYLHDGSFEASSPQSCIDFINNTLLDDTAEEHY